MLLEHSIWWTLKYIWASQVALAVKNLPASARDIRDVGSVTGLGRSPGEGHRNPPQYYCLVNSTGQRSLAGYTVHLILCHPLLLLPSIFPSLSNELDLCIRWTNYWSFSISLSNENWRLTSFRIDWFDLLADKRTLGSPLQSYNSKASIVWCSAFFVIQLSHHTWLLEKS